MQIDVRSRGIVDVLDIGGRMTVERESLLRNTLDRLLDAGEPLFILNMLRVTHLDTTYLGELVTCREQVRKRNGVMKLVLAGEPRELIVATGLDRMFEIFADEEGALDSFAPETETAGIP